MIPTFIRSGRTGVAAILAVASVMLTGCFEEEEAEATEKPVRPVLSMVVGDVERFRTDSYPGRAKAVREVNVSFEVSGRMITRPVDVGSTVRAGDILGTVDPEPYLARIRTIEGERAALVAALANAETELARREKLLERDFVSQANVDDQAMVVDAAIAKIDATDGLLDAARLNLGYTELAAPFDGGISEVFADNFQNIIEKQPVMRLLDTSQIEMDVGVPEDLIGLASYVEEINVTFSSLPGVTVPAEIVKVGSEASLTTRTYPVTIQMEQPDGTTIQPGMAGKATARVRLPDNWAESGVEVPSASVFSPDGEGADNTFIWVINDETNTVSSKPVNVVSVGARGLMVQGLDAGDRIVIAGAKVITEGQEVRIETP